jgi:5'-nucleotidase
MEGRFLGCPAIAFSLAGERQADYKPAAQVARKIIEYIMQKPLADVLLNVNIPDVDYEQIKDFAVTRLGNRHKSEPVLEASDPRGRKVYWVGPVGTEQDAGEGTDFHAVRSGKVSITPLQIDLTRHQSLQTLSDWTEGLK